jgi:uncharacterized protein YuzE
VRTTYDSATGSFYVYVRDGVVPFSQDELDADVIVDRDAAGHVVGVEFVGAGPLFTDLPTSTTVTVTSSPSTPRDSAPPKWSTEKRPASVKRQTDDASRWRGPWPIGYGVPGFIHPIDYHSCGCQPVSRDVAFQEQERASRRTT